MNKILEEELKTGKVNIFMDDIIIGGETRNKHDKMLISVVEKLIMNNLKIIKEKGQFVLGEVNLLGVKINGRRQSPHE